MKTTVKMVAKESPSANVPLEHIIDHKEIKKSYRPSSSEWVAELMQSIIRDGMDTPITCWDGGPDTESVEIDGETVRPTFLLAGFHRREALRRIKAKQPDVFRKHFPDGVPVVVRTGSLKDALCVQLRENCSRKDPTVEELLPLMQRLRDEFGMIGKAIAGAVGKSSSYVSQVFAIEEELGDEAVEAVKEGKVSAKEAIKAAASVRADRKAGKTPDVNAVVEKAKSKTKAAKDSGESREKKRPSLSRLWKIYKALPGLTIGKKLLVLENIIGFCLKEQTTLVAELKLAKDKVSKTETTPPKMAKAKAKA
jgi:ParB-like chromosome segregation protein Spo0J